MIHAASRLLTSTAATASAETEAAAPARPGAMPSGALARIPLHPPAADAAPSGPNVRSLANPLRTSIETLSGLSLADVRVHYDSSEPAQVNALAHTQGSDIHLGHGQEKHLPHEAWHVVQQKQGRVRSNLRVNDRPVNDEPALEREADAAAKLPDAAASRRPTFAAAGDGMRQPLAGPPFATGSAAGYRDVARPAVARPPIQRLKKYVDDSDIPVNVHISTLSLKEAVDIFFELAEKKPGVYIEEEGDLEALAGRIYDLDSVRPIVDPDAMTDLQSAQAQQTTSTTQPDLTRQLRHSTSATAPSPADLQIAVSGGVISGLELLRWFNEDMTQYINDVSASSELTDEKEIMGGPEWLLTAGKMAGHFSRSGLEKKPGPNESWIGSDIAVSSSGTKLSLAQRGKTERIFHGDEDPSYQRVIELLGALRSKGMSEPEIALALLGKMKGGVDYQYMSSETVSLLDLINGLMFGVEGSRVNLTFATAIMILEFIASGAMTFEQAFAQNEFGGEFPLASLKTGSGNLSYRRKAIEGTTITRQVNTMLGNPQKHQVPLKEMMTLINWALQELQDVLPALDRNSAEQLIRERFRSFLHTYYGGTIAPKEGTFVNASELRENINAQKRKRDFNIIPPKRPKPEAKGEEEIESTAEAEELQKYFDDRQKKRRRQWWRQHLDKEAMRNPAANIVIMQIILHPEAENDILDRLRLTKHGHIMGWLRGG